MDYEKAYNEALERASKFYEANTNEGYRQIFEEIFPELKESDAERMIRIIGEAICTNEAQQLVKTKYGLELTNLADWLEKQGERTKFLKSIQIGDEVTRNPDGVLVNLLQLKRKAEQGSQNLANSAKTCKDEPKFPSLSEKEIVCLKRTLDFLREEHNSYIGKDFTNEIAVLEWLITHPVLIHSSELQPKQDERNPAWSEEDEKMVGRIRGIIERYAFSQSAVNVDGDLCEREFIEPDEWLKSLKERYTWKPSDEQMSQLECVAVQNKDNMLGKELMTFFNDLKKLTE